MAASKDPIQHALSEEMTNLEVDGGGEFSGGANEPPPKTKKKKGWKGLLSRSKKIISKKSGVLANGKESRPRVRFSDVVGVSEAADFSEVADSSEADDSEDDGSETADQGYQKTEFWSQFTVGVVKAADSETVWTATIDLCRHLLAQENPILFMVKAAKLAAQLRDLRDGSLKQLLVNHVALKRLFTLDADVHLDIQANLWNFKTSATSGSADSPELYYWSPSLKEDSTDDDDGFTSCPSGMFSGNTTDPLTICSEDSPEAPLRLCFSNKFLYQKQDQPWLEEFLNSIHALTERQALIFGPALACLFVKSTRTGLRCLPREISEVQDSLTEYLELDSEVIKIIADLKVSMPPQKELGDLLRFLEPALHELPQVHFNTVVGGLVLCDQRTNNAQFLTRMMGDLRYYQLELVSVLRQIEMHCIYLRLSEREKVFSDFAERNFSESWSSYRRLADQYGTTKAELRDPFWKYSRVFSDKVFDGLTFELNRELCSIGAVFLDLHLHPEKVKDWPTLGPQYKKLTFDWWHDEPSWRISRRNAVLAENIYRVTFRVRDKRCITPVIEDTDSVELEGSDGEPASGSTWKLPLQPYAILVTSCDDNYTLGQLHRRVHAAIGLTRLERVAGNCLKAEFQDIHKAFSFLAVTTESLRLVFFRVGIIHYVEGYFSFSDLRKRLRRKYKLEFLERSGHVAKGAELGFRGVELPSHVEYLKLCLPVEPSLCYRYLPCE